jgi:hypothetical protein
LSLLVSHLAVFFSHNKSASGVAAKTSAEQGLYFYNKFWNCSVHFVNRNTCTEVRHVRCNVGSGGVEYTPCSAGCKSTVERLMLMLICCERKTLLNGWLILADKFK